jgi:hypothetical protein
VGIALNAHVLKFANEEFAGSIEANGTFGTKWESMVMDDQRGLSMKRVYVALE